MFKNIFGNHKEDKLEIEQDWASFFCKVEDKPASIRLNLALNQIAPVEKYNEQIWFSVKFMNPDENGFTTREEFETINTIEDGIVDNLGSAYNIILAGAVKTDGRLDLYMYTTSTKEVESIIRSTMLDNFKDYQYAVDIKQDKGWEDYFNFLYPNPYEFQTIQNRRVILQLEQNGDNPEIKRKVDHWVDFKDETSLETFVNNVISKGYEVVKKQQIDQGEFKYSVNVAREDVTIFSEVNDYVWELIELAHESNGKYIGWGCPIAN